MKLGLLLGRYMNGLECPDHVLRHVVQNLIAGIVKEDNYGGRHHSPCSIPEVTSALRQLFGNEDTFAITREFCADLGKWNDGHRFSLERLKVCKNGTWWGEVLLVSWWNTISTDHWSETVENCLEYRQWAHWWYDRPRRVRKSEPRRALRYARLIASRLCYNSEAQTASMERALGECWNLKNALQQCCNDLSEIVSDMSIDDPLYDDLYERRNWFLLKLQKPLLERDSIHFLKHGMIAPLVAKCDTADFVIGQLIPDPRGLRDHLFRVYIDNPNLPQEGDDCFDHESEELEAATELYNILAKVTFD
jgi:hypothetical protein